MTRANWVRAGFAMVAAALFAFVVAKPAATSVAAESGGPAEVVAVTFSSAWCASCRILKPRLARVIPEFADAPVKFVEIDFSFGAAEAARAIAVAEGVEEAFDDVAGATGFTLLIDRDTGAVIDMLTASYPEKAMRASIASALAIAARTPAEAD
ncbi:MAG: thioredoxin domain-containing protein [Pseudomonadota bacterium]